MEPQPGPSSGLPPAGPPSLPSPGPFSVPINDEPMMTQSIALDTLIATSGTRLPSYSQFLPEGTLFNKLVALLGKEKVDAKSVIGKEEEISGPLVVLFDTKHSFPRKVRGGWKNFLLSPSEEDLLHLLLLKYSPKNLLFRLLVSYGQKKHQQNSLLYNQLHRVVSIGSTQVHSEDPPLEAKLALFTLRPSTVVKYYPSEATRLQYQNLVNCSKSVTLANSTTDYLMIDCEFYQDQSVRWVNIINLKGDIVYEAKVNITGYAQNLSLSQVQNHIKEDPLRLNILSLNFKNVQQHLIELFHENTVLIGQDIYNDLIKLGIMHAQIIDLVRICQDLMGRSASLKNQAQLILNELVQQSSKHDPLQDNETVRRIVILLAEQMYSVAEEEDMDSKLDEHIEKFDLQTGYIVDLLTPDEQCTIVTPEDYSSRHLSNIALSPSAEVKTYSDMMELELQDLSGLEDKKLILVILNQCLHEQFEAVARNFKHHLPFSGLFEVVQPLHDKRFGLIKYTPPLHLK